MKNFLLRFLASRRFPKNAVAADVSPLHVKNQESQSRLTSAATVQGLNPRNIRRGFTMALLAVSLAMIAASCGTTRRPAVANRHSAEAGASHRAKASFYTCGMHPQVRSLDPDGKCPICQMPLLPAETVLVVDPQTGKTNDAASFPAVSGYYSCAMHPTVLSRDPHARCPECQMALLPVENPVFVQGK